MAVEDGGDHGHDAHQHDDTLDEVIDGRAHVAAHDDVDTRQRGHDEHPAPVGQGEGGREELSQTVEEGGGVGDEEDKDDGGGHQAQSPGLVAQAEEIGHGAAADVLGHDAGAAAQEHPGHERADEGVAQTDPRGGQAEVPAEASRVADENDRGEVGRAEGEGGEPGAYRAAAQDEAVHALSRTGGQEAHQNGDGEEDDNHSELDNHDDIPPKWN